VFRKAVKFESQAEEEGDWEVFEIVVVGADGGV
jgi:hypothetical protein